MKNILTLLILCFSLSIGFAQSPVNLNQGNIEQKKYLQTFKYEKLKRKILVNVSINGKTFKFLFDTGAPFAVSKKIYEEFKLSKTGSVPLQDASGKKEEMIITTLPNLQLGEITFLNTPGIVLEESSSKMFKCFGIEGIIGSNMLRNSVVQIDDENQQITITDNIKNLSLKNVQYQDLKLSQSQSNPFVEIVLQKKDVKISDNVLFDTGADGFYEMSTAAYNFFNGKFNVIDLLAESKGSFVYGIHGMNDNQQQFALNIPSVLIAGNKFNNVKIATTSSNESRIGYKVLEYGKTTLDYKKKRFYFEPYQNKNTDELTQKLWQIFPTIQNDKLVVGIIWDKQLDGKINLGDEILNFDNIDYQNMNVCELFQSDNKSSNTESTVKLKDIKTGEIKTVKIKRF